MFGFKNVENKLKMLAKINLICTYIVAAIILICSLVESLDEDEVSLFLFGVLVCFLFCLFNYIFSWCLYAFAEMVEGIKESSKSLRDIRINTAKNDRQKMLEEEQKKAAEEARASEILAEQKREEERKAAEEQAEKVRKERFDAYWEEHAEEREKLLVKKAAAEKKLKGLSSLAVEERKAIQELIQAIEHELTKER